MKLRFLSEAEADALDAAKWYNTRRRGVGDRFLAAVASALHAIERDPLRFARIERPRTNREIRRHRLKRFPYCVIYERIDTEFVVLAISHAKRRPTYWIHRKTNGGDVKDSDG